MLCISARRAAEEMDNSKKVIVIGDGSVGKTCFVSKVTEGRFISNYHTTIGVEYGVKVCKRQGVDVRLCLWDIAGQSPFRSLMPQFGRNALAAIVMCDVTRKETMDGAKLWKEAVDSSVLLATGNPIPCVLLANKYDCPQKQRRITSEELQTFVLDNGFIRYYETSVKDGTNISEAIDFLIDLMLKNERDGELGSGTEGSIVLNRTYSQSKKSLPNCC